MMPRRTFATPLAALMILLAAGTARAQEAPTTGTANAAQTGNDEVTLKDGGFVKGTVTRIEPGVEVVIIEAGQTEPRTIPWEEVADVQRGVGAGAPVPPPSPGYGTAPPPVAMGPAAPAGDPVTLHITSDEPVILYENLGASATQAGAYTFIVQHSREVCVSPCDRPIDGSRGQAFYVAGDGVPPSDPFRLGQQGGSAELVVETGSTAAKGGGRAMIIGGASLMGVGLVMGILGGVTSGDSATFGSDVEFMLPLGIGLGAGGAALLIGGIVLVATNGTNTELRPGKAAAGQTAAREPRYWLGEF